MDYDLWLEAPFTDADEVQVKPCFLCNFDKCKCDDGRGN
jgi:hypothetical protein